ncbi:MAG TPA: DMT family transporter [Methanocorpusculum sp.]|nr:DMT family transporter [Methanocorpusculum sp.]
MSSKSLTSSVLFCSILVLLASVSYALLSTIVSLAAGAGFALPDILVGKFFYGWLILAVIVVLVWIFWQRKQPKAEKNPAPMPKRVLLMVIAGIVMALVTILYFHSFAVFGLPVSLAVVLLFQYSWIGVVVEWIARRKAPSKGKIIACVVIFIGTFLAAGIFAADISIAMMNPIGILCGIGAAVCYAVFVYLSGEIETQMPPLHKSFLIATVALVFVMLFIVVFYGGFPSLAAAFTNFSAMQYSIPLGIFGIAIPVFFLAVGAPKISTGMATILNSAELPVEVFLAILVLGDANDVIRWIGVVVILLGIALPYIIEKKITSGLEE